MDNILNLFFPTRYICLMCKEERETYKYICKDCLNNLEIVHGQISLESSYIKKVYYSLYYNRFAREMIREYKYNSKNYLCKVFGEIMINTIEVKNLLDYIDLITYIPAHRRKEALRGYNQAELLAQYISKKLNKPLLKNNLIKFKWTENQSHSNKADRLINLRDSFYVKDSDKIKEKKILLIDDIITTGATMEECSRILMNNGAREIIGLALTSSKEF